MRTLAFALVALVSVPAVVAAAPVHRLEGYDADLVQHDQPGLRVPGEIGYGPARRSSDLQIFRLQKDGGPDASPASGISFGPIHAESQIINGRRRVHYSVNGLSLMGGEVGGSVSHHGAMLTLHWPSSGN